MLSKLFLPFLLLCTPLLAEKTQTWTTVFLPIGSYKKVDFSFRQQYRFESSELKLIDSRYTLLARKQLVEHVDGEIHFTLIYSRRLDETLFRQTSRLELELNPRVPLTKDLELRLRNRYERLHRDTDDPRNLHRFRQRHALVWALHDKALRDISIHNEVFYNITTDRVDEYRFVPVELSFDFWKGSTLQLFNMLRWRRLSDRWVSHVVFGITLRV